MIRKIQGAPNASKARSRATMSLNDREISLAAAKFRSNKAFVKSADGKPSKLSDTTLYVAENVSGIAGNYPILTPNTKEATGKTNFNGNKLNPGRNVIISAVRVLYTKDGDLIETADWQNLDRLPAELQNSDVVMKQGADIIFSMPLTDLQGFKYDEFRKINDRPFIKTTEPITIDILVPTGVTCPVETAIVKSYLRLEFRVTQAKS